MFNFLSKLGALKLIGKILVAALTTVTAILTRKALYTQMDPPPA